MLIAFPRAYLALACGCLLIALGSVARAEDTVLAVHAPGNALLTLTLADVRKLPSRRIHASPEHRPEGDYDCTTVASVLSASGVALGKTIRGKRMAEYLLVKAADDYEVVFALPEVDPEFTDRLVLLCCLKDGSPLAADEGPLRIVVPDDKHQARWVRKVTDFFIEKK